MTAHVDLIAEAQKRWKKVVAAERVWTRGANWWRIALVCGHTADVLHGPNTPLGERVLCYFCEKADV